MILPVQRPTLIKALEAAQKLAPIDTDAAGLKDTAGTWIVPAVNHLTQPLSQNWSGNTFAICQDLALVNRALYERKVGHTAHIILYIPDFCTHDEPIQKLLAWHPVCLMALDHALVCYLGPALNDFSRLFYPHGVIMLSY